MRVRETGPTDIAKSHRVNQKRLVLPDHHPLFDPLPNVECIQFGQSYFVSGTEDPPEAEPTEPIPLALVTVRQVLSKANPQRAVRRDTHIVGPIVPVKDVDASLVPEVGNSNARGTYSAVSEKRRSRHSIYGTATASWMPVDLVGSPE